MILTIDCSCRVCDGWLRLWLPGAPNRLELYERASAARVWGLHLHFEIQGQSTDTAIPSGTISSIT